MAKLVSGVYGDALFELALEEQKERLFLEEAQVLLGIITSEEELVCWLEDPRMGKNEKSAAAKMIFEQCFSMEFAGFLRLLIHKNRIFELQEILIYFIGRMKEYLKIGIAYVAAAFELTDTQKEQTVKCLLETTGYRSFEMHYAVDKALLGGMVIRIGDRIIDTSIQNQLLLVSKQLYGLWKG